MEEFKRKLEALRPGKYTIQVNSEYKGRNIKIEIICNICGYDFSITPRSLLQANIKENCISCKGKCVDTKSFIIKAEKTRPKRFSYSLVKYDGYHIDVEIICLLCNNTFKIKPINFLDSRTFEPCPYCRGQATDKNTFIIKAVKTRGNNKYDFSNTIYNGTNSEIKIKCLTCNFTFSTTPTNFLSDRVDEPCMFCRKKVTNKQNFIYEAEKIRKTEYDYSLVNFIDGSTEIDLICKKCETIFQIKPTDLFDLENNCLCIFCNISWNTQNFIEKAEILKPKLYNYSKINYIDYNTEIEIICNKCNTSIFVTPKKFFNNKTTELCIKCNDKCINLDSFIKKAKKIRNDFYDYNLSTYNGYHNDITIKCKRCQNEFITNPSNFLDSRTIEPCPICCTHKKLNLTINDYQKLASENNGKYLSNYIPTSTCKKSGLWQCKKGHKWFAKYTDIFHNKSWCPICFIFKRRLIDYKNFAIYMGGEYIIDEIPENTNIECLWTCFSKHTWYDSFDNVHDGNWCKECNFIPEFMQFNKLLSNKGINIEKTLIDYQNLAKEKKSEYILDEIPKNSTIYIEGWKCDKGHIFSCSYSNLLKMNCCPTCTYLSRKVPIEKYHEIANFRGGKFIDNRIPERCDINYKWQCEFGHIWEACYHSVNRFTWCPMCKNKTEKILYDYLTEKNYDTVIKEFQIEESINPLTGKHFRYDFLITLNDTSIIIELDGYQHFRNVLNWTSAEVTRKRDVYKMIKAIRSGYYLIRLLQDDVYNNKNNWKEKLFTKIDEIFLLAENQRDNKTIYILSESNLYDKHISLYYEWENKDDVIDLLITEKDNDEQNLIEGIEDLNLEDNDK
jgi:very-short-patch-repair endonuclease